MDFRQLRYFAAVADAGTVSAAADSLQMTQPALSRQIQKIEAETGLVLFNRTRPRLTLTSEGKDLLDAARGALQGLDRVSELARRIAGGEMRTVSLAAPRTTLIDVVAPFVAQFSAGDPIPSVIEISISPDLPALLATTDLAVTTVQPESGIAHLPLAQLPVCVHVLPEHRWVENGVVDLSDLVMEKLIVTTEDFRSRCILDGALQVAGFAPRSMVETTHGRIAQALAAAGRGVAVVSDDPRFGLVPLNIRHRGSILSVPLFAAWRADHFAVHRIRSLAERLRHYCLSAYGETLPEQRSDLVDM